MAGAATAGNAASARAYSPTASASTAFSPKCTASRVAGEALVTEAAAVDRPRPRQRRRRRTLRAGEAERKRNSHAERQRNDRQQAYVGLEVAATRCRCGWRRCPPPRHLPGSPSPSRRGQRRGVVSGVGVYGGDGGEQGEGSDDRHTQDTSAGRARAKSNCSGRCGPRSGIVAAVPAGGWHSVCIYDSGNQGVSLPSACSPNPVTGRRVAPSETRKTPRLRDHRGASSFPL
jgi:hypothetical protein